MRALHAVFARRKEVNVSWAYQKEESLGSRVLRLVYPREGRCLVWVFRIIRREKE